MARTSIYLGLFATLAALASVWSAGPPAVKMAQPDLLRKDTAKAKAKTLSLADKLMQKVDFPGIDDPKTTLTEALDKLAKKHDLTFKVDERGFKFELLNDVGRTEVANPNAIPPMKARLSTVLKKILAQINVPSGATWLIREDAIEITTNQFAKFEIYGLPDPAEYANEERADTGVLPPMPRPIIQADIRKTPLIDVLDALAEQSGMTVVFDPSVGEKKAAMLVSLKGRNLPLDTALLMLASMADLTVVHLDNAFLITSQAKAATLKKAHAQQRLFLKGSKSAEGMRLDKEEEETDRLGRKAFERRSATPALPKGM